MGLSSSLKSVVGLKEYSDENEAFKVLQSDRDPNKEVAKFLNEVFTRCPVAK